MTKKLLFTLTLTLFFINVNSQNKLVWSRHNNNSEKIAVDKSATRDNFPKVFQLFDLNSTLLRQELFSILNKEGKSTTIISLPNADGQIELFEVMRLLISMLNYKLNILKLEPILGKVLPIDMLL